MHSVLKMTVKKDCSFAAYDLIVSLQDTFTSLPRASAIFEGVNGKTDEYSAWKKETDAVVLEEVLDEQGGIDRLVVQTPTSQRILTVDIHADDLVTFVFTPSHYDEDEDEHQPTIAGSITAANNVMDHYRLSSYYPEYVTVYWDNNDTSTIEGRRVSSINKLNFRRTSKLGVEQWHDIENFSGLTILGAFPSLEKEGEYLTEKMDKLTMAYLLDRHLNTDKVIVDRITVEQVKQYFATRKNKPEIVMVDTTDDGLPDVAYGQYSYIFREGKPCSSLIIVRP